MTLKLKQTKILYLIKTMDIGGAERFTLQLCRYFKDRTASVTVASSGGIFVQQLELAGIKHIKLVNQPELNNILSLYKELKEIIRGDNYSIIHCQHRIFAFLIQFIRHKKSILLYTANNVFNDMLQKIIFPDYAAAASESIYNNLRNTSFISENKITRINYGVNIPDINNFSNETITFGFIGRLISEKGIFNLLEAVKILSSENLNFRLIIRGKGELEKINSFIKQNNISSFVSIATPSFDEDEIYKDIDVLVLPTTLNEGLPISILEAAARKILVVSAKAGGVKDFLLDGQTGVLLNSTDPKTIANKLKDIIIKYDNYSTIRINAFNKVKNQFSLEIMNKEYEVLYNRILESIPS